MAILALLGIFWGANALAVPVKFTGTSILDGFDGAGSDIDIPGTAFGDTITVTVIADNGGASLASQSWSDTDIVSAVLQIGSYTASYSAPYVSFAGFGTDAAGNVSSVQFVHCCAPPFGSATDNFGTSNTGVLFANAVVDTQGRASFWSGPNYFHDQPDHWSVQLAGVPVPATLALFGLGLLGLGWSKRQRS